MSEALYMRSWQVFDTYYILKFMCRMARCLNRCSSKKRLFALLRGEEAHPSTVNYVRVRRLHDLYMLTTLLHCRPMRSSLSLSPLSLVKWNSKLKLANCESRSTLVPTL